MTTFLPPVVPETAISHALCASICSVIGWPSAKSTSADTASGSNSTPSGSTRESRADSALTRSSALKSETSMYGVERVLIEEMAPGSPGSAAMKSAIRLCSTASRTLRSWLRWASGKTCTSSRSSAAPVKLDPALPLISLKSWTSRL
jgi:hypothetical protein